MEPYQERVVIEKAELDVKLNKLTAFLESDLFARLPEAEQARLKRQHEYMDGYSGVLTDRIANFAS